MKHCRLCQASALRFVFDLGILPLGFPVTLEEARSEALWRERLIIYLCEQCGLAQTKYNVPPEQLITENLYPSNVAQSVREHDERLVYKIEQQLKLHRDALIIEIGCGDGSLLRYFNQLGFSNLIGIEPAVHPSAVYPFPVIRSFLNEQVVRKLIHDGKQPDLIVCNYVLELVPDVQDFLKNIRDLMKEGAFLVIEVPYFLDFVKNRRVDGFAHLRCLWFTLTALVYAFQYHGLEVITVENDGSYRGGTLRAVCRKGGSSSTLSLDIQQWVKEERGDLFGGQLDSLHSDLENLRRELQEYIDILVENSMPIYGYGGIEGMHAAKLAAP